MIFVDRGRVAAPASLRIRAPRLLKKLREFFSQPEEWRAQRRPRFDAVVWKSREIREALRKLFCRKCAFCESFLPTVDVVSHFRPPVGALGLRGEFSPGHYWWLTYDWEN